MNNQKLGSLLGSALWLGATMAGAQVAPPEDRADAYQPLDGDARKVLDGFQSQYARAYEGVPVRATNAGQRGAVSVGQLRRIAPQLPMGVARQTVPHLNTAMQRYQINTPRRMAAFLAQVAHESGGFVHRTEIASGARYEGRRDLGNTRAGDGRRFKGRGYIQLTGRANYTRAGRALNRPFVQTPTAVAQFENAATVSGWFWDMRRLNALADRGDFTQITRRINGGQNGRRSREQFHTRARRALGTGN